TAAAEPRLRKTGSSAVAGRTDAAARTLERPPIELEERFAVEVQLTFPDRLHRISFVSFVAEATRSDHDPQHFTLMQMPLRPLRVRVSIHVRLAGCAPAPSPPCGYPPSPSPPTPPRALARKLESSSTSDSRFRLSLPFLIVFIRCLLCER